MHAKTIFSAKALLGEGPVWLSRERRLFWLDIEGRRLHRFDPASGRNETFPLPDLVGCLAPVSSKTGETRLLLAGQSGVEEVRVAENSLESLRTLAHPERDKPRNRYNDGKCSPEGRFWFGSLNMYHETGRASLYRLDATGCRTMLTEATNSNGLGWSPDGKTFYWIDTPTRRVDAFDYDPATGDLSGRRTVIRFPEEGTPNPEGGRSEVIWGRPDGMTVDAEGMLWIAHWLGGRVTRWNPNSGGLLETVWLPVSRVTSATFGGEDLETLFITTASKDMTPEEKEREPEAGNLFAVRPGAGGLPADEFSAT